MLRITRWRDGHTTIVVAPKVPMGTPFRARVSEDTDRLHAVSMTSVLETDFDLKGVHGMIRRLFPKHQPKNARGAGIFAPLIVDEQGSAIVFESIEDAERYLEPIDVENNEYVAYDSEGRLLRLLPTTPQITIESAEVHPKHSKEVRDLLIRLLIYTGVPEDQLRAESLKQLVTRSLEYKTK